jgi:hypothetical protein
MLNLDPSTFETRLFINNEFVNSVSGKTFDVVNPATEEVICAVQEADAADVDKAVSGFGNPSLQLLLNTFRISHDFSSSCIGCRCQERL